MGALIKLITNFKEYLALMHEAFYTLIKKRKIEDEYFNRFNYENYGGTPILGLKKSVVIGHGISNDIAIKNMIVLTADVVEADLPSKIKNTFNHE